MRREPRIKRRGRIWYAWVPDPIKGGLKLQSTNCTDKTAAAAKARDLERRATDPGYASAQEATVRELVSAYVASRSRKGRADETIGFYRKKLGHLARLLPPLAKQVTHSVLERYIDLRLQEGVQRTTIAKEIRAFRAAWRHGRLNKMVDRDADEVFPEIEDNYTPRQRWLTPEEAEKLCRHLPSHRAAIVAFAVACGAEWAAIQRATRHDLHKDGTMIALHGTKRRTRERWTPLPFPQQRQMVAFALAHGDGAPPLLFSPWSNARRDLHAACKATGIPPCSPNDLRRTYGQWLRQSGVEPSLIGAAMGHADSRMVERVYGKLAPEALTKSVQAAVRYLFGAGDEKR